MCIIVIEQSDIAAFANYVAAESDSKPAAPSAAAGAPEAGKKVPQQAAPSQAEASAAGLASKSITGRVFASPFAKKIAASKGLDLTKVSGSGPGGRIRSGDLDGAPSLQAGMSYASASSAYEDLQLTNMRQVIAKRLLQSKQTIPHYYLTTEINVDELLK